MEAAIGGRSDRGTSWREERAGRSGERAGAKRGAALSDPAGRASPRRSAAGTAERVPRRWLGNVGVAAAVTMAVVGGWWLAWWMGGAGPVDWTGRLLSVATAAVLAISAQSVWPPAAASASGVEMGERRLRGPRSPVRDALIRMADRLTNASALDEVLGVVTEEAARALRTPVGVFLTAGDGLMELEAAHGLPNSAVAVWPPVSLRDMESVFGAGRLAVIADVRDGGLPGSEIHAAVGARGVALAWMTRQGETVGVLAALSLDERRAFSPEDLQTLRGVADQATQAVASARLLEETRRRLRRTQGLRNIDIAIAGSMDLRITLNVILHETLRQLEVDAAAVLLLDRRTQVLQFAAGHGFHGRPLESSRLRLGEGLGGRVALERQPLRVSLGSVRARERLSGAEAEGFRTYWGLPLVAKGEVQGVLEIYHRRVLDPDSEWSEYVEALAGQAAIAIDSATLFDELQRLNTNLVQAYDSTLEGWSRALDLRDRETEGHTRRVTDLAMRLARELGIDDDEMVHLRRGAILHDIGKMGIPDSILLKPGPLTDDEWRVMRQHPVLAYELLTPISYLRPAVDIPYCHHERWDGTGYPRGLRGDDIPLSARIFAIADVWDALRSDRPYRKAWPATAALEYIRALSGAQFDPDIVEVFERVHTA